MWVHHYTSQHAICSYQTLQATATITAVATKMKPTASPPSRCTSSGQDTSTATMVGVTHVSLFWLRYPQLSLVTLTHSSTLCISLFVIILQSFMIAVLLDVELYTLLKSYPIYWRTCHLHLQDMTQVVLTFTAMIAVIKCQQWSAVYVDTSLQMCKDFMEMSSSFLY